MRPTSITVSATGNSNWIPVDYTQTDFNLGIQVTVSSGASLIWVVQLTSDDVFDPDVTPTAITAPDPLNTGTGNEIGSITTPVRAVRLNVTVTSGTVTMTVIQGTRAGTESSLLTREQVVTSAAIIAKYEAGTLVGPQGAFIDSGVNGWVPNSRHLRIGPNYAPTLTVTVDALSKTVPTGATEALNTTQTKDGTNSVKLTSSAAGGTLQVTCTVPSTVANRWGTWIYVHDYTKINYIQVSYGQGGSGYTDSLRSQQYFARYSGWHYIESAKDGGPNALEIVGAGSFSNPVVRCRVLAYPATGSDIVEISWHSIFSGGSQLTDVMIVIDDGESTGLTQSAFTAPCDYMAGLGVRASLAIFGSAIGAGEEITYDQQYGTLGMLRRAYRQGHELVVHGQYAYNGGTLGTYETVLADHAMNKAFLVNNGFAEGADFLVLPIGSYGQVSYIDQALSAAGVKMAREVYTSGFIPSRIKRSDEMMMRLWIAGHLYTQTAANITGLIDAAIAGGMHICLMFHKFVADTATPASNEIKIGDFYTIVNHVVTKRAAGLCQDVTMSEFWARRDA